ncbi:Fungalysin/Thermolysin Extracellular metalloproteinase 5 [Ceratobasidium sp. UAMH 11750]|nr:Fungalysin/Thermolysin Extracellular metalloproteinase 5 [Ceratobasidium sp. UAMH 11750]
MADNWYEAYISVNDPSIIVAVADWASDSPTPRSDGYLNALGAKIAMGQPIRYTEAGAYKVWKWGLNAPDSGERTVEPASYDSIASPFGWHTISKTRNVPGSPDWVGKGLTDHGATYLNFTTTWGNNVFTHENWEGRDKWISNYRPEGDEGLNFTFSYGVREGKKKDPKDYVDLTVTQLFYTTNMIHDLFYRYGFDERAGNFQQDNYGRGGRDGDAVIANAQDSSSYNNANFVTPPDGQHGRCRMYIWNTATPYRDGDLEAGLAIHELSHGLSNRLTGGPLNSGCLVWGESGGMGEGWGDFIATTVRNTTDPRRDLPVGDWANNKPGGARNFPYSTNSTVNPSTYETLNDPDYWMLHTIGEVWGEILWIVSSKMVEKHGYSPNLFPPQPLANGTIPLGDFYRPRVEGKPLVPKHGNTLMLLLVIQGMKH